MSKRQQMSTFKLCGEQSCAKDSPRTLTNLMLVKRRSLYIWLYLAVFVHLTPTHCLAQAKFHAVGVDTPRVEYFEDVDTVVPRELRRVAVEVNFDLVPTKMLFSMPCYPCMVTENGIHFSNGWTETYDPKASSSCEVLWDDEATYARMWIESQNPARIVVRWRAALADPRGYIAHSDIPSGSPYGKGDWTDEWYYIYPDGTHTRHVRIYTGLSEQSLLVTDETFGDSDPIREIPPNVVHEFQEDFIFGSIGHLPTDDIEQTPITLIKMDGRSKSVAYDPYPKDFAAFADANIKVVNTKSKFRPFTVFVPYGLENEPYPPEGELPYGFQTWLREPQQGYTSSLGHSLNWWHYRRTENRLEQIYLSGMTNEEDPTDSLVALARSWLEPPQLQMAGIEPEYKKLIYDPAQKAYTLWCNNEHNTAIEFTLATPSGDVEGECYIVNPVLILEDWGEQDAAVALDGRMLQEGTDYRAGHESVDGDTNLVIWLNYEANKPTQFRITPLNK